MDCGAQSHVTYCNDYTNPSLAKSKLGSHARLSAFIKHSRTFRKISRAIGAIARY